MTKVNTDFTKKLKLHENQWVALSLDNKKVSFLEMITFGLSIKLSP